MTYAKYNKPVNPLVTFKPLSEELAVLGGNLLVETLQNFWEQKEKAVKQPDEGASPAPKISKGSLIFLD